MWRGLIEPDPRFPNDIVIKRTEFAGSFEGRKGGPLTIWEEYIPGVIYVASQDTGHGLRSDYTVGGVMRLPDPLDGPKYDPPCNKFRQVAEYRTCTIDPELSTIHNYLLCMCYGYPLWGIEWTGMGRTAISAAWNGLAQYPAIQRYPHLYRRIKDEQIEPEITNQFGWDTNKATKIQILQSLRNALDSLEIYSLETLNEMEELQYDESQSDPWMAGYLDEFTNDYHDDGVMHLAILYRMALKQSAETTQERMQVEAI